MGPLTLTAIATFLSPFFEKAGNKIAEKTVEKAFESLPGLAQKFKGLFVDDIITLGLSEGDTPEDIKKQMEENPALKQSINEKVAGNQDLLNELLEAFKSLPQNEFEGITINAKNIGQVINNPQGPITQTNTFN
ncbi:MAG: hypothetical protein R2747_05525 [Pyrinomonadaceae bacterium]